MTPEDVDATPNADLRAENARLRKALEEIRQLVHPKGDEERLEGCAGCKADRALGNEPVRR